MTVSQRGGTRPAAAMLMMTAVLPHDAVLVHNGAQHIELLLCEHVEDLMQDVWVVIPDETELQNARAL